VRNLSPRNSDTEWRERLRIIVVSGLLVAALLTYGVPRTSATASVDNVKFELKTALFYMRELAKTGPVYMPPLNGQRVVNCLEGPEGQNYNKFQPQPLGFDHSPFTATDDPCAGQDRNGIIPDLKDLVAAKVLGADEALKQATLALNVAVEGMANKHVSAVKGWARSVGGYLKAALDALGS
jgi:hypothetical protein